MNEILERPFHASIIVTLILNLVWLIFYWRKMRPHCPPVATTLVTLCWLTNFGLLLLNLLYIIDYFPEGHHLHRRWYYQGEGIQNIPTLFSTAQLLFAGALALTIGLRNKPRVLLRTGYWLLFAVGFFTLALDEILVLHERWGGMYVLYVIGGVVLLVGGILEARRRARLTIGISFLWIFGGLSIAFLCAKYLDRLPQLQCWNDLGICFILGFWEENAELLGVLSALTGLLAYAGATIPVSARGSTTKIALASFAISIVITRALFWQVPRVELHTIAHPLRIEPDFANLEALGFRWDIPRASGRSTVFLYLRSADSLTQKFGFSIEVLDQTTARLLVKQDEWNQISARDWLPGRIYRQRVDFQLLYDDIPTDRALWLALTLWRKEGEAYPPLTITASDQHLLSDTQVVLGEYVFPAAEQGALPDDALDYRFGNNFALRGAEIPANARTGDTLAIPFTWQAVSDSTEDWVQFLHFVHEETGALWNHDQQPLGARLPTRLWYEGLRDTEAWQITLPADLASGNYAIYTGLYRLSDLARLPVSDVDGLPLPDARVPLGYLTITGA